VVMGDMGVNITDIVVIPRASVGFRGVALRINDPVREESLGSESNSAHAAHSCNMHDTGWKRQ